MFTVQAYLTGFSSLKDGGASIRFATQELSPEDFVQLRQSQNEFGHLLFKGSELAHDDIPKEQPTDSKKSPAQRLRASLFVLWKQQGAVGDFDAYYRGKMESMIQAVQDQLD